MRIGLVLERFDPARGGREQWTYCFAGRLAALGHEVHVVARDFSDATRSLPIARHAIHCDKWPMTFAEAAKSALEPLMLDIIHDMGPGFHCDIFHPHGGSLAAVAERKLLFLPSWLRWVKRMANRLLPRHRMFQQLMDRQYADRGQILLALSRSSAEDFRRHHGIASERIRIVHNGVDTERFSPERCSLHREAMRKQLRIKPDEILALIVAHNFRLKGVATLLKATQRLAAQGLPIRLAVVGGKRIDAWRRRAERMDLGRKVTFVGRVDDPLPYYAATDVYVHPTFYDSCSLVVLEAAACGLPIITSRYNGAAELFHHGGNVRLISDPADAEELAVAMRTLMDAAVRHRIGAAARQIALAHTFSRNVDQLLELYREILRRRGYLPHGYAVLSARISGDCGAGVPPAPMPVERPAQVPGLNDSLIEQDPIGVLP